MLSELNLLYFKCFERLDLPLRPLTLLAGTNASGKSSVLQSLVLVHQTMRDHEWSTRLMLNGRAISLGSVVDVVDQVNGRTMFTIGLLDGDTRYGWSFVGERSDMSMSIETVFHANDTTNSPESLRFMLPPALTAGPPDGFTEAVFLASRLRGLTYLSAERVGPREVYTVEDKQVTPVVGPSGVFAPSVLHWGRDEQVVDGLAIEGESNKTRLHQVSEWMRRFFPGSSFVLQPIPQTNALTFGLRTSPETDFHRPINVGFGLTQVFPIIVAALSASKGDIVLIENPEVHLHPAGQALMGQLLAQVANAGVQVIIETHSDHVLNGIRRHVKTGGLEPDHVAIHFFQQRSPDHSQVISPQIDAAGNLDDWPEKFFDQFDKDANFFAGWGE